MAHATDPPKMERNIVLKKVFYTGRTSNEFISVLFRILCYSNQDIFRFLLTELQRESFALIRH